VFVLVAAKHQLRSHSLLAYRFQDLARFVGFTRRLNSNILSNGNRSV